MAGIQFILERFQNIVVATGNVNAEPGKWYHAFVHEPAHIFCNRNEVGGKKFKPENVENGYKLWTEFIAEYKTIIVPEMEMLPKSIERGDLKRRLPIAPGNLYDLSFYLAMTVATE